MDSKREWIIAVNYGKYLAFILATILVIISKFIGGQTIVKLALACYVSAFCLAFISLVIHANEVYKADREAKKDNAEIVKPEQFENGVVDIDQGELKGKKVEVVSLKKEQFWTIVGAISSGIFAIFTFVVLILL